MHALAIWAKDTAKDIRVLVAKCSNVCMQDMATCNWTSDHQELLSLTNQLEEGEPSELHAVESFIHDHALGFSFFFPNFFFPRRSGYH